MKNPILDGSGYKYYALVWAILSGIHVFVLFQYYEFTIAISITDGLIHNTIYALIVPGLWYIVRFASIGDKEYFSLIATHLVGAGFTSFVWSKSSAYLLGLIFFDATDYLSFLDQTSWGRMFIGATLYCTAVLLFYLIRYYLDLQEKSGKELELQALLKDSELRMLKTQINPHFIFNSLNSVSALTVSKPESAREMIINLSTFLRYSIGKDSIELNSLKEEIDNASLYLDIEKVRFGSKLQFETEVSNECLKTKVPNLILQPLIENAIKYGVYESIDDVIIKLICEPFESMLYISVINNYDPDAVATKGEGIGLDNVRKRLTLVYGRNDLLQLEQKDDKFIAIIKIPLEITENE